MSEITLPAPERTVERAVARAASAAAVAETAPRFYLTHEHHPENGTLFGFWLYLMSDCLVFACLFAVYAVLGRN